MTKDRDERLGEILEALRGMSAEERAKYLDEACEGDPELRAEAEALMKVDPGKTDDFFDRGRVARFRRGSRAVPEQIGVYRIRETIGEGGMGIVYRAEQENPRRDVALKVVLPGFLSEQTLRRFEYEVSILGRLKHPGIAQIYEAGTADSGLGPQPYFAMELIEGESLLDYARKHSLSIKERMELLAKIADAVHYAHQQGIVHRDLKPGNVLVEADGQPKILDFGIARSTDSDITSTTVKTDIGQLVGTLAYMSPEQAEGDPEAIDTRSDVYALGVILYELLSGELPYSVSDKMIHEAVRVIREEDAAPLSSVRKVFRGDVETVVGKALEKEKSRRYPSAMTLAEDLRRYVNDEPVVARPKSSVYQMRKFVKRHRTAVAAAAVVLIAGLVSLHHFNRARQEQAIAMDAMMEARQNATRAQRALNELQEEQDQATEAQRRVLELSSIKRLSELEEEAEHLWPRRPETVAALDRWLHEARDLASSLPQHRVRLSELERALEENDNPETRWLYDNWSDFVARMEAIAAPDRGLLAEVEKRRDMAIGIAQQTLEAHREDWQEARESILKNPIYQGLTLSPIVGLVPLGEDPGSGLWEFLSWETGASPERSQDQGSWVLAEETGVVFVLIPGGTFIMGGQSSDPNLPGYDPAARADEGPPREVTLSPYLLSKYELTRAQWLRMTTGMVDDSHQDDKESLTPVGSVSWMGAEEVLARHGFQLPTEAQWEFAARAGTSTAYWTGQVEETLHHAENLFDQSARKAEVDGRGDAAPWEDSFPLVSPIGQFRPNPFGVYDMLGNVQEWCRDGFGPYGQDTRSGDGLSASPAGQDNRTLRGGSFRVAPPGARASRRNQAGMESRRGDLGLRPVMTLPR